MCLHNIYFFSTMCFNILDTKDQWARDDPAFLVLIAFWLCGLYVIYKYTNISQFNFHSLFGNVQHLEIKYVI